ncbi:MAG: hypothetical protein KA368_07115 [Acidobacteria bacterium]|nr:hypothetical protein [Acidobacteriota bacterium]
MNIKKTIFSLAICLTILSSFGVLALADTIKLRDGTVLKGKVISYNQRRFVIVVKIGNTTSQHDIAVEDVESVEFDSSDTIGISAPRQSSAPATAVTPGASGGGAGVAGGGNISTQTADKPPADSQPTSGAQTANNNGELATIAEKTVNVAAGADWTSTEIRIQRGQHIVISAIGDVDLGDGKRTGPEGIDIADKDKLMQGRKTGGLIAVVGDDNNDFEFVGQSTEIIAKHNGILFLSINEGNLRDNNGAFVARVRVLSNR